MIAILTMMLAMAAPHDLSETREFHALGAFQDSGDGRQVQVSTDRDLDADGMADEGIVHFTCRGGRMAQATFIPGPATAMIPVVRLTRVSMNVVSMPTMTARYDVRPDRNGIIDTSQARLVEIATAQSWCAAR